jgi:hypothetical protein
MMTGSATYNFIKKRPIDPYVVELDDNEKNAYAQMRVQQTG